MPFDATGQTAWAIPYAFDDYLELVDWLGRAVHPAKRGRIPPDRPKILDRLGMDAEALAREADRLLKAFGTAVPAFGGPALSCSSAKLGRGGGACLAHRCARPAPDGLPAWYAGGGADFPGSGLSG